MEINSGYVEMAKITNVGGPDITNCFSGFGSGRRQLVGELAQPIRDDDVVKRLRSLYPTALEAAKGLREFGAAMSRIKPQQLFGRTNRTGSYYGNLRVYQSQPAELRRATQLEF